LEPPEWNVSKRHGPAGDFIVDKVIGSIGKQGAHDGAEQSRDTQHDALAPVGKHPRNQVDEDVALLHGGPARAQQRDPQHKVF
jgi:hypothetical protein